MTLNQKSTIAKKNIQTHQHEHMSCVWPVNTLFHTWDRCLFILVDSRLKINLEKKSRQIQAESSDFILNFALSPPSSPLSSQSSLTLRAAYPLSEPVCRLPIE